MTHLVVLSLRYKIVAQEEVWHAEEPAEADAPVPVPQPKGVPLKVRWLLQRKNEDVYTRRHSAFCAMIFCRQLKYFNVNLTFLLLRIALA